MVKSMLQNLSVTQSNDASSINNKRGMARRAKRNSNKRARRHLRKELLGMIAGIG